MGKQTPIVVETGTESLIVAAQLSFVRAVLRRMGAIRQVVVVEAEFVVQLKKIVRVNLSRKKSN